MGCVPNLTRTRQGYDGQKERQMNQVIQTTIDDVQGLEIETFKIEELNELDVNAAAADVTISLCSSTTSSCCG